MTRALDTLASPGGDVVYLLAAVGFVLGLAVLELALTVRDRVASR